MTGGISINFSLHAAQQEIFDSAARFKVCACGRRFGKSWLAIVMCILWGLREKNDYGDALSEHSEVVYIGTTLEQARRNVWNLLKKLADPVIAVDGTGRKMIHENTSVITLVTGVRIRLLGMDDPDAARGMSLRFAVLDEYAQMPANVFPEIIRPALIDSRGNALFIGTPKGRNHFYALYREVLRGERGPLWAAFNYSSTRNTTLDPDELIAAVEDLTHGSSYLHQQEIEANFLEPSGSVLRPGDFIFSDKEPQDGEWKIAVDLGGFSSTDGGRKTSEIKQRDDHAIAIVKVHPVDPSATSRYMAYGWWVKDIIYGKWGVRETALKIAQACLDHPGAELGIEKGALKNAVEPYLMEYFNEYGIRQPVTELRHNNRAKADRIRWALEGRSQKQRIMINRGTWNAEFLDQAGNFPSPNVHDDLIDALAYVDQMAESTHYDIDYVNQIGAENSGLNIYETY